MCVCRYRLTALAVDNEAGPHKNYTVVFIGAESGVVLKVLAKTTSVSLNDSVLLEEIDIFNRAKYEHTHTLCLSQFFFSLPVCPPAADSAALSRLSDC